MKSILITAVFLLLSCNSEIENQIDVSYGDAIVDAEENEVDAMSNFDTSTTNDAFSFPQQVSAAGCTEPIRTPELCEWGQAAHDIILLEITGTSHIISPSFNRQTEMFVNDCSRPVTPGFRMTGVVQNSIKGLSGEVSVDVGLFQYADHWNSGPTLDTNDDGSVKWFDDVGSINVGDVIGLTLHKHPTEDTLGILGEHFFEINEKKTIRFGELYSECGPSHPKGVSGLTFERLKSEINKCISTPEVDERKRQKAKIWENPTYANVGTCVE